MPNPVELSVKTQLAKIVSDLEKISEQARAVNDDFKGLGNSVGDNLKENTEKTKTFLEGLRSMGGRVSQQLKQDFRSLFALNAIKDSLSLSNQFRGSVKEAISLSDTIRKLGKTFGVASQDFVSFQSKMIKGLGDIGMSSEVAARVMEGLADTPVRGEEQLLEYSKTSGKLASISKQQGREGDIAQGMAEVIRARGGNVNDVSEMQKLAEDLRRVFVQTGKGPTETLGAMKSLFANMSQDFRKQISSRGLAQIAAGAQVAGPNSVKFLEEYLSKSPIARMALDAQGMKGVVTDKGLDIDKFRQFSQSIIGRVGGDPRLAAQTLGLSEDAAEGFIRLAQSLDRVKLAQESVASATGSLDQQYKDSLGFAESFRASINRVKGVLSTPLSWVSQKGTDLMSEASQSDAGAAGMVLGGGALAALLAGAGLRGAGKGLIGGTIGSIAKGGLAEQITGKETIPVYVVNASEIGGGLGALAGGGALGKAGSMLGKAGLVGAAGLAGAAAGHYIVNPLVDKHTQGKTAEGFEGNAIERVFFKLDRLLDGRMSGVSNKHFEKQQKVVVELNNRDLKASKQPTRGSSF